jgi:elongation factor G
MTSLPQPVLKMSIRPTFTGDQEAFQRALKNLAQEDLAFRVTTDPDIGQTIISGMGELHLEIIVDRMRREFNVQVELGEPQIIYRETIRKKSEAEGKYIRQIGTSGQYGHVKIRIEPQEPGKGFEFSRTSAWADRFRRNT